MSSRLAVLTLPPVSVYVTFWDVITQGIASYIASGDVDMIHALADLSNLINRVSEALDDYSDNGGYIWPELLPGGNQQNDLLPLLEGIALNGKEHVETITVKNIKPASIYCPENITLDFRQKLYLNEDMYTTNGSEWFVDEQGTHWVKFKPQNGYNPGKEHIIRAEDVKVVVRDD
jgi:hypothetical protein